MHYTLHKLEHIILRNHKISGSTVSRTYADLMRMLRKGRSITLYLRSMYDLCHGALLFVMRQLIVHQVLRDAQNEESIYVHMLKRVIVQKVMD